VAFAGQPNVVPLQVSAGSQGPVDGRQIVPGAAGLKPQVPPEHVRAPSQLPADPAGHEVPHEPQKFGLVWRLRQVPLQQVRPAWQSLAPVVSQACPSPARALQTPPTQTWPGAQQVAPQESFRQVQVPPEQTWLAVQEFPQVPQVVVVVFATHAPPQQVLPVPQPVLFGAGAVPQIPPVEQVATRQVPAAGCGQLAGPVQGVMQPWAGS
jgi:hypothetical protein